MSGPQCCANAPKLDPKSGAGQLDKIGGLNTYVTAPSPHSNSNKQRAAAAAAVILISDVFGYEAPHIRKIADKFAAAGLYAAVPDFFHGDAFVIDGPKNIYDWIKEHPAEKGFELAKPVIQALKSKGITSIGAVGFCWGAKAVVQLANKREFIQAGVLVHPSFVTVEDIKGVEVPLSILAAEIDQFCPPSQIKEYAVALTAKLEVDSFVKVFPKVEHGWAVRYDEKDESAVKEAEEAQQYMLEWFVKYLK